MLKKLIVVYNPRSSHHQAIEREVLAPVRKLQGWLVGKYEVKSESLEENARALAELLHDGDLVITAGGDGTATMATNGIMLSKKDVTLGVLGYGNFDDMARMLKTKRPVEYGGEYVGGVSEIVEKFEAGKTTEIYPLEAKVDGKHWRYAPCYLTVGLLAESTAVFDEEKVRKKLKTGKKGLGFSVWQLMKWYFRHHGEEFLPEGELIQKRGGGEERQEAVQKVVREDKKAVEGVEKNVKRGVVEETEAKKKREKVADKQEMAEKTAEQKKERVEKRAKRREEQTERWQKRFLATKKGVLKGVKSVCKKWKKLMRKMKSVTIEISGRSKARVSDFKVRTEVKVAETRQKRQEKHERELANKPEIIIDTELTRVKKEKEDDEDED